MKGIVVTGSNGGIGTAIVQCLQDSGYFVIGTDVGKDKNELPAYIECDLRALVAAQKIRDEFLESARRLLDGRKLAALVNNAAFLAIANIRSLNLSDFSATMNVNVTAALALSQMFIDDLEEADGAIVNIGSIHAKLTKPGFINYATSKAALRGLTQAMAVECGSKVRVNLVEPSAIETPMLMAGFVETPEAFEGLEECHPVGRIGQPNEVAEIVAFLISDKSRFVNGSTIEVNGGIGARLHDPV